MTRRLAFAEAGQAEGLAAFLARLLRYDRRAAVRLRTAPAAPVASAAPAAAPGDDGHEQPLGDGHERPLGAAAAAALAVFGHAPALDVLVIRTVRLAAPPGSEPAPELDVTVSAGQLADAVDTGERTDAGGVEVALPEPVTGPSWAGLLPPRGGWRPLAGLPPVQELRAAVAAGVAEFRVRVEALPEDKRTRSELDRIGDEIWGRTLGETPLPLRAAHAAHVFGLLAAGAPVALLAAGAWLRLRTPSGSVALRRSGGLGRLGVTPV